MNRIAIASLLASLVLTTAARAQEQGQEQQDAWDITLDLGFNATRGNTYLTLFSTTFEVKRLETQRFELGWNITALYGEDSDSVVARRYKSGLTFDYRPEERISPFIFVDAERDQFRKLDLRTNAGAGARYVLWRTDATTGSISAAALHDYEDFSSPLASGDATRTSARWSIRGKTEAEWPNGLGFEHVTFYKPGFEQFDDYNIDSTTKVTMRLNERIGLNVSWAFRYDSTPPPDVRRDDQILQVGVTLDW